MKKQILLHTPKINEAARKDAKSHIAFFALGKRQKAERNKPDPDADYGDEYGDEIDIPEGEPEDEGYEE